MAHARGQHQGGGGIAPLGGGQLKKTVLGAQESDLLHAHMDPKILDLLRQSLGKGRAAHAGQTGVVVHQGGVLDLASGALALQHQHVLARPGGIQGGSQARRASAHYNYVIHGETPPLWM